MVRDNAREFFSTRFEKPALSVLSRLGLSPNAITLSGLLTAGVSAYLLSEGWLLAGGVVYWLSGIMDLLDGALARATGRETRWGALLDSLTDRVSESVVLLGILLFYLDDGPQIGAAVVFAALAASFMVSYVRARAEGLGIECKVGVATRPERVVLLGVGLITGQWWKPAVLVVLVVVTALSAFTAGQRALHVYRRLDESEAGAPGSTGNPPEDR